MKQFITILTIILLTINSFAQIENHYIRQGNRQYKKHNYARAESKYKIALNKNPRSYPALFNLGLALYRQHNDTSALASFLQLSRRDTTAQLKAKTFYNLGDIFTKIAQDSLKNKQLSGAINNLQNAVKAFKSSVILNPHNYQARYNLWVTKKLLDSLKQQQQKQQKNKQNQNNKNNKNKQNKQKNNQNKQGNKNKQNQNKNKNQNQKQNQNQNKNNQQNQKPNNQKNKQQNPGLNQQEINRILSAIQQADKQTQRKAMKRLMNIKTHERKLKPW